MNSKRCPKCSAIAIFVSLFFLAFVSPVHARQYTLEQAVSRSLEANPTIESKKMALDRASLNIGAAQSYFWPRLSIVANRDKLKNSGGVGSSEDYSSGSRSIGFQATLSLFAGFTHLNQLEKSVIAKDVAKEEHRLACLELGANVQATFIQLLKAREELKHALNALKRIEKQLESAKAFVKVDMAPQLDVLQNQADLSKAQQDAINAENAIRNAKVQLNHFLGYPPHEEIQYIGALASYGKRTQYNEEESIRIAMRSRPDLRVAQGAVQIARKDRNIAAGAFLPKVDLVYNNMEFRREYKDTLFNDYSRDYWTVSLRFTWDFFDGGNTTFSTLGEHKRMQALQKNYENYVSEAQKEIIRAILDIASAKRLIQAGEAGLAAAMEGYRMAEKRYATSTGTITELLDAQARLSRAEYDLINAHAEHQIARVRYYYHIGKENPGLQ